MDWHGCGTTEEAQDVAKLGLSSKADFPRPARYAATESFAGRTKLPDFRGRDRKFNSYRTRIRDGMRAGPNFVGHFSIIQIGCGTGCSFAIVGDNNSGRPADFPRGGEENMYMQLQFSTGSRLLTAQWLDYDGSKCVVEFFDYDRKRWNLISVRGQRLTAESVFDSRLPFGGCFGRANRSDGRGVGGDRAAAAFRARTRLSASAR